MAEPVLLVDDDPEICRFLGLLLELEGFQALPALDAGEARAVAERERPVAALVDLAMPEVDGLELCRQLRAGGFAGPIFVMSARPGPDLPQRALDAGADEFIRKPFDNADLVALLRSFLMARPGEDARP